MTATPTPAGHFLTPEQLAAVAAAVELVWPVPEAGPVDPEPDRIRQARRRWRFSGRWWSEGGVPGAATGT